MIKPEWRTPTVLQVCQAIRLSGDYATLPHILADQLEQAGCDDQDLLSRLRAEWLDDISAVRIAAEIYSEETAAAVRWVDEFASDLGPHEAHYNPAYNYKSANPAEPPYIGEETNYDIVMEAAADYIATGEDLYMGCNEAYGGLDIEEFWRNYVIITGREPPWRDDPDHLWHRRGSFFSCSC